MPRKNVAPVAGRPLIAWSIEAALTSRLLDWLVVCTDDTKVGEDIAAVACNYGVPSQRRPPHLAQDDTPMAPVIEWSLAEAERTWGPFDYVCILQPTSPQRTGKDIDQALCLLMERKADSVVSVYEVADNHPARMYVMSTDGFLLPYDGETARNFKDGLRQRLPPVYHRNGAIYVCRAQLVRQKEGGSPDIYGRKIVAYLMPKERSGNIDDPVDIDIVDAMLRRQYEHTHY